MPGANSILVVDDEPYITDVVTAALRFEGFTCDEASTGADALSKARLLPTWEEKFAQGSMEA